MAHIKCEPFGYHDYGYGPEFGSMPIAKCDESPTSSEEHLSTFCLWPCPSYERAGTQEVHLGRTAQHISHSPPVPGGELSEKSRQVQQAKRYGTYPDSLIGSVFETTGMVVGSTVCLRVTHMMIDTSAPSIIISSKAADQAGLKITECSPKTFTLANGTKSTYHQLTQFQLYISGIHAQLSAFVDNGNPKHHILLGKPGIKAFSATANFAFGQGRRPRSGTVAEFFSGSIRRGASCTRNTARTLLRRQT